MDTSSTKPRTIKSVSTLFAIVQALQDLDGAGVTEIAVRLDLSKSTVHKYLKSMELEEYVVNDEGTYRLGLRFLNHGMYARNKFPLAHVAEPALHRLAEDTGEVVWLVIEEHGRGVYVRKKKGKHAVQPLGEVGKRPHLHYLAAGKAILAQLPCKRVQEIIDRHGLKKQTDQTITDSDDLLRELDAIDDREGIAFNDNEEVDGLRAVGAPVMSDGDVCGAISVSGPTNRMQGERFREKIPNRILGATNEIELKLLRYPETGMESQ